MPNLRAPQVVNYCVGVYNCSIETYQFNSTRCFAVFVSAASKVEIVSAMNCRDSPPLFPLNCLVQYSGSRVLDLRCSSLPDFKSGSFLARCFSVQCGLVDVHSDVQCGVLGVPCRSSDRCCSVRSVMYNAHYPRRPHGMHDAVECRQELPSDSSTDRRKINGNPADCWHAIPITLRFVSCLPHTPMCAGYD